MSEQLKFRVELNINSQWVDLSRYVQPDWGTDNIISENSLFQFTTQPLSFRIVDRDTDKDTRYWYSILMNSSTSVQCRVSRIYGDTEPPSSELIFFGFVNPEQVQIENDCITGFSAIPILSQADRIDMTSFYPMNVNPQFSGLASELVEYALRHLGCQEGSVDDVVIQDMKNADDQNDWNHTTRQRYVAPGVDISGDFCPKPDPGMGNQDFLGWRAEFGKLFKIFKMSHDRIAYAEDWTSDVGVPGLTIARVFPFHMGNRNPSSGWGLAIVYVQRAPYYSGAQYDWEGWKYADPALALGTTAGIAMGWLHPLVAVGVMAGSWAAKALTRRWRWSRVAEDRQIKLLRVYPMENDGALDLANYKGATDGDWTEQLPGKYSLMDWCCVRQMNGDDGTNGSRGEFIYTTLDTTSGTIWLKRICFRGGNTLRVQPLWYYNDNALEGVGYPVSLAAAGEAIAIICTTGILSAVHYNAGSANIRTKIFPLTNVELPNRPRFFGAVRNRYQGKYYSYFLVGGKKVLKQHCPPLDRQVEPDAPELIEIGSGMPQFQGILASQGCQVGVGVGISAASALIIQKNATTDRFQVYAGLLKISNDEEKPSIDLSLVPYPVCGSGEYVSHPPVLFRDAENNLRFVVPLVSLTNENTWVSDWYVSSQYSIPYLHWHFGENPMTIGEFLRYVAQAYWCYLRILDPSPCNSQDQVRVVSRHYWTPTWAGKLGKDEVLVNPHQVGVQVYDGVSTFVNGDYFREGSVKCGKNVFNLSSPFLTGNWARNIIRRIKNEYCRSELYPQGRRVFQVVCRVLKNEDDEEVIPNYQLFGKRLDISFLTGQQMTAVVMGVGFSRDNFGTPLLLLEYGANPTSGKGYGVDWESNSPELALSTDSITLPDPIQNIIPKNVGYEVLTISDDFIFQNPVGFQEGIDGDITVGQYSAEIDHPGIRQIQITPQQTPVSYTLQTYQQAFVPDKGYGAECVFKLSTPEFLLLPFFCFGFADGAPSTYSHYILLTASIHQDCQWLVGGEVRKNTEETWSTPTQIILDNDRWYLGGFRVVAPNWVKFFIYDIENEYLLWEDYAGSSEQGSILPVYPLWGGVYFQTERCNQDFILLLDRLKINYTTRR